MVSVPFETEPDFTPTDIKWEWDQDKNSRRTLFRISGWVNGTQYSSLTQINESTMANVHVRELEIEQAVKRFFAGIDNLIAAHKEQSLGSDTATRH